MRLDATPIFAHAVNGREELARFLLGPADVAEGDVSWGTLRGDPDHPRPIMAHPPDDQSDLSFDAWVGAAKMHGHSLKVDLKSRRVLKASRAILLAHGIEANRLIVNADVVQGPGGPAPQMSASDLGPFRSTFPEAVLSPGATTRHGGGAYTAAHVRALLEAVDTLGAPITVPLRAEFVLSDPSVLDAFVAREIHLTIWNDPSSFVAGADDFAHFRRILPTAYIDLQGANGAQTHPP
jgi:hypothetical protein